jgi:uncharacterized protein (TIGR02646 family)
MEKITKPSISAIPTLIELSKNYIQWGKDFETHLQNGGKSSSFTWKGGLYKEMRHQLCLITKEHCTFCDGHPIGDTSKETIEHYYPKGEYPLKSYDWDNLFYCCDKCQSEANKKPFQETLKPDNSTYQFDDYFYFDLGSGELKILENLVTDEPETFAKANAFLLRYGISNNPIRNMERKQIFKVIQNILKNNNSEINDFKRDDFKYRYIYDYVVKLNGIEETI